MPKNVFVTSKTPFSFPSRNPDLHGISQLIESDLRYITGYHRDGRSLFFEGALFHMYPREGLAKDGHVSIPFL